MSFPFNVPLANIKRAGTQTTATTSSFLTATGPSYSDIYIIEYNGLRRDQTGTSVTSNSPNWDPVTSGTLQAGKGYAFLVMSDKAIDFVSATGATAAFDFSTKATTVGTFTANGNIAHNSWNLVGIPYTSAFNLANLDQNTFYYLYSQTGQNYEVKERADSYQLYPFSAFFMQASTTTLNFAAAGRALKASAVTKETAYNEIDLQISNNVFTDRTRIRLANNATAGYTINEDAVKMMSPNNAVPQLWSKSGSYDLSVNALPGLVKEIPLVIRSGKQETLTIKLNNSENAIQGTRISLVDTEKNQTIDLQQTDSYTFTAEAGSNTTRFKIVLQSDISTHATISMENGIKVSIINNQLTINGMDGKASVHIYDASGKAIRNFYKVDNNQVLDLDMQKGLYFIEISTASQCVKQKVLAGQN